MRLSAKTRYGVRAVFDIAFHGEYSPETAIQAKDIARREEIPLRYLEQIFQDLRRAGLIESKRGPRGGYLLKKAPEETSLGELVTALQGPISELFCLPEDEEEATGSANSARVTAELWKELGQVVTAWFENIRLSDLVKRGNELGIPRGTGQTMYFI